MLGDNSPRICCICTSSEQKTLTTLFKDVYKAASEQGAGLLKFRGYKARDSLPSPDTFQGDKDDDVSGGKDWQRLALSL